MKEFSKSLKEFLLCPNRIGRGSFLMRLSIWLSILLVTTSAIYVIEGTDFFGSLPGSASRIFYYIAITCCFIGMTCSCAGMVNASIARLHDCNMSGLYFLIIFIPGVQMAVIIWTFFCAGSVGRNQFGEPPYHLYLYNQNVLKVNKTENLQLSEFKDQRKITNTIKFFSWAFIIINFINICFASIRYYMYQEILRGDFSEINKEDAISIDQGLNIVSIYFDSLDCILMVCMATIFLIWLYRSNQNVRILGVTDLKFTPRLAVLSYIIPIFHFWWPYQAMKEIWMAGRHLIQNNIPRSYFILRWWWGAWIFTCLLDCLYFNIARKIGAESPLEFFRDLEVFNIIVSLSSILLNIFLILMVKQIYTMLRGAHSMRTKVQQVTLDIK